MVAQCETRPRLPLGQSWLRLLGTTTAEACRPGWSCPDLDEKAGQDCRRAPSRRHMWTPAQAPRVPVGWGPCPQGRAVCSQRLLQPLGAGHLRPGSQTRPPGSDQCPTPAPPPPGSAHPQAQAAAHPPTHTPLTKLPVPPRAACQELGPQDRCGPCPLGPCSPGGGWGQGTGRVAVTAVWLIDFCSSRPWNWGRLGPGWATWVPGPQGSLGRPRQGPWQPTQLPLRPPASCPLSAGCALRLPHKPPGHSCVCREAARFLRISALLNLCAAATEEYFL